MHRVVCARSYQFDRAYLLRQSVLLGNCSEEYPWWPTPKLTNFDNAIETDEDDLLNPFLYNGKVSNHGHSLVCLFF